jgi:hypothetical protein
MNYVASASVKKNIYVTASTKNKISVSVAFKTLSPEVAECPEYDLIDGGFPNTIYSPINGFNLIDGGTL